MCLIGILGFKPLKCEELIKLLTYEKRFEGSSWIENVDSLYYCTLLTS